MKNKRKEGRTMGLRFRKSIKIAPGLKVNLNKNSISTTVGTKGIHYTANSKGTKTVSAGIPGTGLSYTAKSGKERKAKRRRGTTEESYSYTGNQIDSQNDPKKKKHGCLVPIVVVLAVIFLLNSCLSGDELKDIVLSADTANVYDINTEIPIELTTDPDKYSLSEDDFDISGGTLNISDNNVSFSADEGGAYTICAKHSDVESNTLTIKVEDKEAIAKAKEEEAAKAEAEAKKKEEEAKKPKRLQKQSHLNPIRQMMKNPTKQVPGIILIPTIIQNSNKPKAVMY